MEPEVSSTTKTTTPVRLELFKDGMITLFWDDILDAIRATVNADVRQLALLSGQVRKKQLQVVGAFVENRLGGIAILRQVVSGLAGDVGLFLEAFYGRGLTNEQWLDAARQLEDVARNAGFAALYGHSTVPRVDEIAKACGWKSSMMYTKELRHE